MTALEKELSALREWAIQGATLALDAMRELETALGAFVTDERNSRRDETDASASPEGLRRPRQEGVPDARE